MVNDIRMCERNGKKGYMNGPDGFCFTYEENDYGSQQQALYNSQQDLIRKGDPKKTSSP